MFTSKPDQKSIDQKSNVASILPSLSFENYIQKLRDKNDILAKKIADDLKNKKLKSTNSNLREWLQNQNVINMYRVCLSFHRGALFYDSDYKNPIRKTFPGARILTTESALMPVMVITKNNNEEAPSSIGSNTSYMIKDDVKKTPQKLLSQFLFSRTAFECAGSINHTFLLTLIDLLKSVFGETEGKKLVDLFLKTDKSKNDVTRLLLGSLSASRQHFELNLLFPFYQSQYISTKTTEKFESVFLNELKKFPEKYLGFKFSIAGHPDYLKKHPDGNAQAWNVIFAGLNSIGEPLFLAACETGEKFLLSYSDIINKLVAFFDEFPHTKNSHLTSFSGSKIEGIVGGGTILFFNMENIEKFLTDLTFVKNWLTSYVDIKYKELIKTENANQKKWISGKPTFDYTNIFISKNIIRVSKDDSDLLFLRFFRPSFRPEIGKLKVKDDSNLLGLKTDNYSMLQK